MTEYQVKRIPYGTADYRRLRQDHSYYVDKTHFIPLLEDAPYYLFCIRPRRFGKSLWLSVLQSYYDVNLRDEFELLFGETAIGANPTAERNSYLVLTFNFAAINPASTQVQDSFSDYGRVVIGNFLRRYASYFTEQERAEINNRPALEQQLRRLFAMWQKRH